jgi:14-3-3 protein epsilon
MEHNPVEDLIYMCTLYHREQRDKEALEALNELIGLDPVFDKSRRVLFQAIYKLVIDSLRDTLNTVHQYYESDVENNRVDQASLLQRKKEELCSKLIFFARDAITSIDQQLLPNASDPQMIVFFHKLKGDLFRYIAEFSDDTDSLAAGNSGEESYTLAFDYAESNLPRNDPVRMSLILNAAVFRYEIRKDPESATDMLEHALKEFEGDFSELGDEDQQEVFETLEIMRGNLQVWMDDERAEADE